MTRTIEGDWYAGTIPRNAELHAAAYIETSYSFELFRSTLPSGFSIGNGSSAYLGTMFDVGERGSVRIGEFCLLNGVRIVCDDEVSIGDYALISWNVVVMDSYRLPRSSAARRRLLEGSSGEERRHIHGDEAPRPVRIGRNAWIGFDSCILPGVTIGDGSVIGARSVVGQDVAPYTVVAGNPARFLRNLDRHEERA
jgi:acetyltransferase-like isoleucine patch superfamily enzyme